MKKLISSVNNKYLNFAIKYKSFKVVKPITKFSPYLEKDLVENAPLAHDTQLKSTADRIKYRHENKIRHKRLNNPNIIDDWTRSSFNRVYTEKEAIAEASRCFKCADSPCRKSCSTGIDIRSFIYQIENRNYYGAAKTILSDNPLGLSCGALCPITELCASTCNAHWLDGGVINIGRLQEYACKVFKEMRVKQIRDPNLDFKNLNKAYQKKIAIIGCGPASISCATYLARMGYSNVHVFEKKSYGGGLVANEIPPNRTNWGDLEWEISLMTDLGVKVHYNKQYGKDITYDSLKKEGYEYFFFGVGFDKANSPLGTDIYMIPNVYNSKVFLPNVCENTKKGMIEENKNTLFKLSGHVMVLGIGDTALDCARSALRLGAKRVSVIFRRGFDDLRANDEIFDPSIYEGINFIPYSLPKEVVKDKNGLVTAVKFYQYQKNKNDQYETLKDEISEIKCDYLITAFGSEISQKPILDLLTKDGKVSFDKNTNRSHLHKEIYLGGDITKIENLVDAVNDGKNASFHMHKQIQESMNFKVPDNFKMPGFYSEIDKVDISIKMAGKLFTNPFGLASAPPATSYPMIRRAFEQGWGFCVVKTFVLDKDMITNISPRIYKSTVSHLNRESSFANIELISEKKTRYWVEGAKELKNDFPDKVLIGSIMASPVKEDWQELTLLANEANFDMLELNLSCNHGMPDKNMGKACSDSPEIVGQITKWVVEKAKMPVFIKLSPNSSINGACAIEVKKNGGIGISTTNTMSSFMDPTGDNLPWPKVGKKAEVFYGGAAGSVIRPISLRVASEIATLQLGLEQMATGGIITGDHAMSYAIYGGCKVFQVCSAVQENDFSIIQNLTSGLQANIYLNNRKDLAKKGWKGQSPPVLSVQTLKKFKNEFDLWDINEKPDEIDVSKLPKLEEYVGKGFDKIQHVTHMDVNSQQFPHIDDDLCVNCGKCYMTCLDSGYQAIKFNSQSHKPEITKDCTGCGLCFAVCPVPGALLFYDRTLDYVPNRGDEYFEPRI